MEYFPYHHSEFNHWFRLAHKLFPDYDQKSLKRDLEMVEKKGKHQTFFAKDGGKHVGFATVSTRIDYVEGASTSPVGYLEAVYVEVEFRKMNVARELYKKCEQWALSKGCSEMGSDTWIDNLNAQDFHNSLGFIEDDRLVHYIKKIKI